MKLSNETNSGSLEILDPSFELPFAAQPTEYQLDQAFDFASEAVLGAAHPVVSFRGPGAPTLSVRLVFDQDLDEKQDLKKVEQFVEKIRVVSPDTRSVPEVRFRSGGFQFRGYVQRVTYRPSRLTSSGDVAGAGLELVLIGSGEK